MPSRAIGFGFEAQWSKQVIYQTGDGRLHELSNIISHASIVSHGWRHTDLTVFTGAPIGILQYGFVMEGQPRKSVLFPTLDGNFQLDMITSVLGSTWSTVEDPPAPTGSPFNLPGGAGVLAAYALEADSSASIFISDGDGHILD